MKVLNPKSWVTVGAGLLATVALLPQAKGELVYENNNAKVEDRAAMRQALDASEKAQVTLQAESTPVAAPSAVAPAPAAPAAETQNYTKAELMRRERQRQELKNEDILQERLEELRLRDERRRTDEVLQAGASTPAATAAASAAGAASMKEEVVVSPVTEHPGKAAVSPAPMASDSMTMSQSVAVSTAAEGASERTMISVVPRAGLSNMVGQSGYFEIRPHYSAGVGARVGASDNFSFEIGYTFSQYGVAMASSNPFVIYAQQMAAYSGQSNFETVNMNQNVFDAGLKVHLLGPDSKLRPFLGAGGAYARSYINFASNILNQMNSVYRQNISPDYNVNNFLGYLSGGMEFKVAKNISVGAEFRYYAVLSDSESSNFNNYYGAMYGSYPGFGGYGVNPLTQDTNVAGGSLARTSFYSMLGTVAFSF